MPSRCVECGREQPAGQRGWKAYLTTDEEEPAEAVVYCPACGLREFDCLLAGSFFIAFLLDACVGELLLAGGKHLGELVRLDVQVLLREAPRSRPVPR